MVRKKIVSFSKKITEDVSAGNLWSEFLLDEKKGRGYESSIGGYRLSHWDLSLVIPDLPEKFSRTIRGQMECLLGISEEIGDDDTLSRDAIETVFHELFHVFQILNCKAAFEYFYYSSAIQIERNNIFSYLINGRNIDKREHRFFLFRLGDTFFHHASLVANELMESGDDLGVYLSGMIDLAKCDLQKFKNFDKPVFSGECSARELIEGGAAIFGLCSAGYKISRKLLDEKYAGANADLYKKSYFKFLDSGGDCPLIFIIFTLVALRCSDTEREYNSFSAGRGFDWLLSKMTFLTGLFYKKISGNEIHAGIRGFAFDVDEMLTNESGCNSNVSVYRKFPGADCDDNLLLSFIKNIEENDKSLADFDFLLDVVSDCKKRNFLISLINKEKSRFRLHQAIHKLEKNVVNMQKNDRYKFECCGLHGVVCVDNPIWLSCEECDSIRVLIKTNFDFELSVANFPDYIHY